MGLRICSVLLVCSSLVSGLYAAGSGEDMLFERGLEELAALFALSQSVGTLPEASLASSSGLAYLNASSTDVSILSGRSSKVVGDKELLLKAAEGGDLAVIRRIIDEEKISLNSRNGDGNTALILAILHGHVAVAIAIIASDKVNFNVVNDVGETALMIAARAGYADLVRRMLRIPGTDIAMKNNDGKTALMLAQEHSKEDVQAVFEKCIVQSNVARRPVKKVVIA